MSLIGMRSHHECKVIFFCGTMHIPIDRPIESSSLFESTISLSAGEGIGRILNGSERPCTVDLSLRLLVSCRSLKLLKLTNCKGVLGCLRSLGDDVFAEVLKSLEGLTLYKTDIDDDCLQRLWHVAPKLVVEIRSKYGETNYLKANG